VNYFEAVDLLDKVKHGHPASIRDINFALFLTGDLDEELKFPIGWTDLKPLETDKSHCVQQQPGES